MNAARAYARTQNETASRERLMVLLFEAALRHMRAGASALEAKDRGSASSSLHRASEIVTELLVTLDVKRAGDELGGTLHDIYVFVCGRLVHAMTSGEAAAAREAERAFAPIVDAFSTAVAQLAGSAK